MDAPFYCLKYPMFNKKKPEMHEETRVWPIYKEKKKAVSEES